jgi:hypothetical protein
MVNLHVLLACLVAFRNKDISELDEESIVHFKTLHGLFINGGDGGR